MKRTFIALSVAVAVFFCAAVGLCFRALGGAQAVASFADGGMRIVLDAGHGGMDGGVVGRKTGVKESDLNLAIVLKLKQKLDEIGFEVTLTRKTEAGLYGTTAKGFKKRDMQKRKEIVEEAEPSLLLSVHQNYYPSKTTRGGQLFYNKRDEKSQKLAVAVQDELNDLYQTQGVKNRTVMAGEYFMLECYDCPSVIVECGFLSSAEDETLLRSADWQERLAEGIAAGVLIYLSGLTA